MAVPQPVGTIKRPPAVKAGSSSSSLNGMERVVPSFQSFLRRTPPLEHQKPLPPPPVIRSRASSSSPPRSRTPSLHASRRSSSVYSRTVSQWFPDDESWTSANFADEPLPPLPMLQPLAYSASTPQLVKRQPTPAKLEARTYSPMAITSSSSASRASTPSPPPQHKASILLPTPPASIQVPKMHLCTVSLEKANATVHSPGAVHLLPEELRAQTFLRSQSHEPMRLTSNEIPAGKRRAQLPEPSVLVDNQGRQRSIHSPLKTSVNASEYPFPVLSPRLRPVDDTLKVGIDPVRQMAAPASQSRKASGDKVAQAFGIGEADEPRGRTRTRGPRKMDYSHYFPNRKDFEAAPASEHEIDAQKIAKEYHALLTEQYRTQSSSSEHHATDSDDSIKRHMKMVPKPLFHTKPPAKLPATTAKRTVNTFTSPYGLRSHSRMSENTSRSSKESSRSPVPFKLSLTPDSRHRRTSTTGSIPISPPMAVSPLSEAKPPLAMLPAKWKPKPKLRTDRDTNRVSAFYPRVAHRKGPRSKDRSTEAGRQTPPLPLLSADIIAQRLKTPIGTPAAPTRESPGSSSLGSEHSFHFRRRSDPSARVSKTTPRSYQRFAKGVAKYADLLTKPSERPETSVKITHVVPGSPHLAPSPVKPKPKQLHLGWTDVAKTAFEDAHQLIKSPKRLPDVQEGQTPLFATHMVTTPRPMNERSPGSEESASSRRKSSSFFGGILDTWKESKAEKRREDLKIIKVVPQDDEFKMNVKRRSSTFGWM